MIVRSLFGPLWIIPWGRSHSIMPEKIGQNLFFTGKTAFFFQSLCLKQPFRCYRIDLLTSTVIVGKPCRPLYFVHWGLSHSIMPEKVGQILFFTGKFAFFFRKIVFSTTSPVIQKWSCNLHSSCQKTLWILINCFMRLVTLDNARKNRPLSFLRWKVCIFFSKFFVFNNLLGFTEMIM